MKIVVTGCAGFIGANFVEFWLDKYPEDVVIGIDALTYAANIPALEGLKKRENFKFFKLNICDGEGVKKLFEDERPDCVINFAAESHVDRSIESSRIFIETNVLGTQTLLDACLHSGVKRFHQISTDEVYGDLLLESKEMFTETSLLKPSSPYSASKAAADLLALSYHRTHGLYVTVSRSANNYGKYQHAEKLVPKIVKLSLEGKPFTIYGNGLNVRNWINVKDHCHAVELIVKSGKCGDVYNVGGNVSLTNVEMANRVFEILDKPKNNFLFTDDRKGHDRKYAIDSGKLISELGWRSDADFDAELKRVVLWYKKLFSK